VSSGVLSGWVDDLDAEIEALLHVVPLPALAEAIADMGLTRRQAALMLDEAARLQAEAARPRVEVAPPPCLSLVPGKDPDAPQEGPPHYDDD
jgi:hypothetical protein